MDSAPTAGQTSKVYDIKLVRWAIRVDESKKSIDEDRATLIGFDEEGREYTFRHYAYVHGESHNVTTTTICYDKPADERGSA